MSGRVGMIQAKGGEDWLGWAGDIVYCSCSTWHDRLESD